MEIVQVKKEKFEAMFKRAEDEYQYWFRLGVEEITKMTADEWEESSYRYLVGRFQSTLAHIKKRLLESD